VGEQTAVYEVRRQHKRACAEVETILKSQRFMVGLLQGFALRREGVKGKTVEQIRAERNLPPRR
jgi:hypothetical protein